MNHKTGARGLRTVLEDTLLDVMYDIPSRDDVKKCMITGESIRNHQRPLLLTSTGKVLPDDAEAEAEEEVEAERDASA